MKTSLIVSLAALATSIFALPEPQWRGKHWGNGKGKGKDPNPYTSAYSVVATPDQVVNATEDGDFYYTGGLKGAIGYYNFALNSDSNTICYNIRLYGFRGKYESPANTAKAHIHEAPKGETGPPRIAFPNPKKTGNGDERVSKGCLTGPFETGVLDDSGVDTGAGFKVKEIEEDAAAFFCDVHSSLAVPGVVRGQLG